MFNPIQVHYRNKIELLYESLKDQLFSSGASPFCRRLIIVPSPALKSWLMLQMAKDPEMGVAAGLDVAYLNQTVENLSGILRRPTSMELALAIEVKIRERLAAKGEQRAWQSLFHYLKIDKESRHLSRKGEQRLIGLSEALADLFQDYQIYGVNMLQKWEKERDIPWQAELWKDLFHEIKPFHVELMGNPLTLPRETHVHLFSVSFIPKLFHAFFEKAAQSIPINFYLLSPCHLFWSDVLSDRESTRMKADWKKQGISESQQQQLDEYLRDRNPMLANFGRLGREMAKQIEESGAACNELYVFPKGIRSHAEYAEYVSEETLLIGQHEELTLLEGIQADMASLRNPEKHLPMPLANPLQSIQVHVAASKMREVQVLYDVLMNIIAKHHQEERPICPGDILVMSPNIMEYEALIRTVFGSTESQLDFHILDLTMPSLSPIVQAFLHLFNLAFGRWDSVSFLQLLDFPDFQNKQKLTGEDLTHLRKWIEEAPIYWGGDENHREEILKRNNIEQGLVENSPIGTWEYGFSRLLAGMVMQTIEDEKTSAKMAYLPCEGIDNSQSELLGKWIYLFRSLRQDLTLLVDGTQLNLREWSNYLECLAKGYLGIDGTKEEHKPILDLFQAFMQAFRRLPNQKFSFASIYKHLQTALSKQTIAFRETHLQAVRFCSMLPMRTIPAQVIVLMGMHEGAYPRQERPNSLNMLKKYPETDYHPSQTDFDRYLFLETLLSARKYFLLTYPGYDDANGLDQSPSLVVTELLTYLDKAFSVEGEKPSKACVWHHPFHAFDASQFQSTTNWKSYSPSQYQAAKAFYQEEKLPPHFFFPDFKVREVEELAAEYTLGLKQLRAFSKNPLKPFFNKALGIYINEKNKQTQIQEDLVLSRLTLYDLKKKTAYMPLEAVLNLANRQGKMPLGLFRSVAEMLVQEEVEELNAIYQKFGVDPKRIFSIELKEHHKEPKQAENGSWQLPPLKILYKGKVPLKITGDFEEVATQGLIVHKKGNRDDVARVWPEFLVFHSLIEQYRLPIEPNLLFTKEGRMKSPFYEDAAPLLEKYLNYYFLCQHTVSPLLPEWLNELMNKPEDNFAKEMQNKIHNKFGHNYNDYLKWTCRGDVVWDSHSIMENWKSKAHEIFGPVFEEWFSQRGKKSEKL